MSEQPEHSDAEILSPSSADAGSAPRGRDFRWGPVATLAWTLVIAAVTTILVLGLGILVGLAEWSAQAPAEETADPGELALFLQERIAHHLPLLTAMQAIIVVVMVVALTRRRGDLTRTRMLGLAPIPVGRCLKWVAIGFVLLVVLTQVPQLFFDMGQGDALDWMEMLQPAWLGLGLLVVLAPVSEELLFRGFVYGGLAGSRIGPVGAILVSSGIWTVIHVQYTWLVMIQIFIYGVVFGVVRWRSGSLWPPMVTHGVVNLLAGIVFYGGLDKL